ncbi:Na/Pi symporter [Magnetovibrio sp. PR-2]|uniref:Na/Pi cotransporter family protein n=1 Tax=Magnetovibrio sp. PR-2 TaxID=3120356 RepID=UPI002FCE14EE
MLSLTSIGQLMGGVGLFLLGMMLMTDGLKVAAGRTLKQILERWTDSAAHGLFSGTVLTALVQSSSAVTVAAIGFVNAGMLTLERSVWVIFGSNIGTTMTGWLVALIGFKIKISLFALPMIGVGMLMKLTGGDSRRGALGMALAGFGLFFIGVSVLKDAFEGVASTIDLSTLAATGFVDYAIFVGVGFMMTLLTQSSSAAISIALAAAAGGMIPLEPAAAMVIGANIGTTSTAMIAVIGATPNAKRVAASHVAFNFLTGIVALILLPFMLGAVSTLQNTFEMTADVATSLALFHTIFNILGVVLILPVAHRMVEYLKTKFVSMEEDLGRPRFLDKTSLVVPSLAVESLIMELSRLQEISTTMVLTALDPVLPKHEDLRQRLAVTERLSRKIGEYARKMHQAELPANVSSALAHPYRALQHFEEIARIAAELPQMRAHRPALEAHAEKLLETYIAVVHAELKRMISADPAPEEWKPKKVRASIKAAYDDLKKELLNLGARGILRYDQLEKTSSFVDQIHACGVRAIKAQRRLDRIRVAVANAEFDDEIDEEERTNDG